MNNFQQKYTSISIEKCNQFRIRKVIKKFVDRCDDIYTYNFCMENKTTNVLQVVKM